MNNKIDQAINCIQGIELFVDESFGNESKSDWDAFHDAIDEAVEILENMKEEKL
jgi:hypothetical protein